MSGIAGFTQSFVETNGIRLSVHRGGAGNPLVLLHGGSGSWMHWIHCISRFAQAHRVLAADLPGLGDSPSPAEPYDARSLAEVVCAGLDAFELDIEPGVIAMPVTSRLQ